MPDKDFRFVILGGGTAGWMAASLLARKWPQHKVTVVESPEIGIIGVGEGSTPQLRAFFRTLGLEERDWMPRCNATYKNGISFHGWSERLGYDRYFHPFHTELDFKTIPAFFHHCLLRRSGRDAYAHPDRFSISAQLAAKRLGPIPAENFPFDIAYGYHFDATLVGHVLRDHATGLLGVEHLPRTVQSVDLDVSGNVAALIADEGERIEGNFFIDCSGFRGAIIQQGLGEPFLPFASNLFNDSAVAMPTPSDEGVIPCETRATALSAGWAWSIPLTNRAGNGYVYSSAYKSPDEAETELRAHLGMLDSEVEARHLTMKVGRVERSWIKNCLAVGLSQGFIEPLEATALHIVQATVEGFIDAFDQGGFTNLHEAVFNRTIASRYEGIRDYIACHYRLNRRTDSDYWRENAANQHLSDDLKSVMTAWFTGDDLEALVHDRDMARYYAPLSWHCLLAGYGTFPEDAKIKPVEVDVQLADLIAIDHFLSRCAANYPNHDVLLGRGWRWL